MPTFRLKFFFWPTYSIPITLKDQDSIWNWFEKKNKGRVTFVCLYCLPVRDSRKSEAFDYFRYALRVRATQKTWRKFHCKCRTGLPSDFSMSMQFHIRFDHLRNLPAYLSLRSHIQTFPLKCAAMVRGAANEDERWANPNRGSSSIFSSRWTGRCGHFWCVLCVSFGAVVYLFTVRR